MTGTTVACDDVSHAANRGSAETAVDTGGHNRARRRHPESGHLVHSVAQAAARLGISRSAGYQLVASGELPARRLLDKLVVLDADLVAYAESLPAAEIG